VKDKFTRVYGYYDEGSRLSPIPRLRDSATLLAVGALYWFALLLIPKGYSWGLSGTRLRIGARVTTRGPGPTTEAPRQRSCYASSA
jgi:hypothetical protein